MRILIIRATNAIGGSEIYNLNLIKAFHRYYPKDELFFITTLPDFSKRLRKVKTKVITLSVFKEELGTKKGILRFTKNSFNYFLNYLSVILKLKKEENNKIDLVCIQSNTEKIFLSPILKILGFSIVWLEHGPFFFFQPRQRGCVALQVK